jgi:hypothetical protein
MGAGVRDRGREELGEVLQPRLGLRGKGSVDRVETIITPHARPSREIGTPIEKRMPISRTVAATVPAAFE